jgi:hypothetical protein
MEDNDKVLSIFPLASGRIQELNELIVSTNYRAIMLNALLDCLRQDATSPEDALAKYSKARQAATMLGLRPIKIEHATEQTKDTKQIKK